MDLQQLAQEPVECRGGITGLIKGNWKTSLEKRVTNCSRYFLIDSEKSGKILESIIKQSACKYQEDNEVKPVALEALWKFGHIRQI